MHTIKISPNLLFEYQCTSGEFITLPNRIESKHFSPELECSTWQRGILSSDFDTQWRGYSRRSGLTDASITRRRLEWVPGHLPVSVSKCSILTVGRVYDRIRYHLNGTELPQSSICRDLGVTITSDLSPSQHISEITLRAHQRANHIQCNSMFCLWRYLLTS